MVGLVGALLAGDRWSDASLTPKLALDLEGGTEIILQPVATGGEAVTSDAINQAIDVIRQRVDASGVAEAEITSQGGTNIVVALPGTPTEETLRLVRESAQMVFRPVLAVAGPQPVTTGEDDATGEEPADDGATVDRPADDADDATGDTADDATAPDEDADAATDELSFEPSGEAGEPTNPSDLAWLTDDLVAEFDALDRTDPANLRGGAALVGDPDVAVVTCDVDGTAK